MVLVEGISVSGEHVEKLKDKRFVILKSPTYEKFHDKKTEKDRRVLRMVIELSDHSQLDYYPNKTSIKVMTKLYGYEMDKWIGKEFLFDVNKEKAFGAEHKVLYVCDKK